VTADQPAEATQPRFWLGTYADVRGVSHHDAVLFGPNRDDEDPRLDYYAVADNQVLLEDDVTDLRPAVVVPQREDEGEVDRLAEVAHDAYEIAAAGSGWQTQAASRKPWAEVPEANREATRASIRAVLAAQRPAAPVGDLALLDAEVAGFERGYRNAVEDFQHGGFRYGHEQAAAPVAAGEATVARVLGEHQPLWSVTHGGRRFWECRIVCDARGESEAEVAAHQAAEVVRALAARDEDGGEGE
jgi:hypothetical protein